MKLSNSSIKTLIPIIIGDCGYTPYLTENKIMEIFNTINLTTYSFPEGISRKNYVEYMLFQWNDTKKLQKILEAILDPSLYLGSEFDLETTVEEMNMIMEEDGYYLEKINDSYQLIGKDISKESSFEEIQLQIQEHLENSKYLIWIVTPHFGDLELAKKLLLKKQEGLNIRIVVEEQEFQKEILNILKHFDLIQVQAKTLQNEIPASFCILDLERTLYGNCIGSRKEKWKQESFEITKNLEITKKFAEIFMKLVKFSNFNS